MRIFGTEVEERFIVAFAAGSIFGGGFFYVAYKLLTRRGKSVRSPFRLGKRHDSDVVDCGGADLMLPLNLEKEYGNGRQVCLAADEIASAYLKQLPDHFFQYNEKFAQLITSTLDGKKCTRALVVGSKTGSLAFGLAKLFTQVKGIERSFTQVSTCFRFQNLDTVKYNFPLEGSLKTAERSVKSPVVELLNTASPARKKNKFKNHERLEFVNCDPSNLPDYFGQFDLVIVNNCLNDVLAPEKFIHSLERLVQGGGTLIISSDYTWDRNTNQETGFGGLPITNSFELLLLLLKQQFTLIDQRYLPDAYCVSNRSCKISNNHVTLWSRNIDKKEMP